MTQSPHPETEKRYLRISVDIALHLAVLAVLVIWCFQFLRPFVGVVVWAIIIAVTLYPLFLKVNAKLGGRRKLTTALFIIVGLALIILPSIKLAGSAIDGVQTVMAKLESGVYRDGTHLGGNGE